MGSAVTPRSATRNGRHKMNCDTPDCECCARAEQWRTNMLQMVRALTALADKYEAQRDSAQRQVLDRFML